MDIEVRFAPQLSERQVSAETGAETSGSVSPSTSGSGCEATGESADGMGRSNACPMNRAAARQPGRVREAYVAKGGQPVPVVMCPGCKKAMRLRLLEPASGNLETATFHCEQCGTETKREFVRDKKRWPPGADNG